MSCHYIDCFPAIFREETVLVMMEEIYPHDLNSKDAASLLIAQWKDLKFGFEFPVAVNQSRRAKKSEIEHFRKLLIKQCELQVFE